MITQYYVKIAVEIKYNLQNMFIIMHLLFIDEPLCIFSLLVNQFTLRYDRCSHISSAYSCITAYIMIIAELPQYIGPLGPRSMGPEIMREKERKE